VGHGVCLGEGRGVYTVLVGRPEEKRPLWRPRCRWGDNIKLVLDRVQWRAFVNMVMNFWVP
jgi:hypothetical protein